MAPLTVASLSVASPRLASLRALRLGRLLALAVLLAVLLAGCAAEPKVATLDPLFRADPGTGDYESDPFAPRAPRFPPRSPAAPAPPEPSVAEVCKHVYAPHGTHAWIDPLTGMPALCCVVRCTRCGELRHECQRGPRR